MATAGYLSVVYVTTTNTNPTASDKIGGIQNTSWNPTRAELDTGILGESFTNAILGKKGNKPTMTVLYTPGDTGQGRLISAFASGNTVYVHYDALGSGSCQVAAVKVSGYPIKSDQAGLVTADFTLVNAGDFATSTVS